jgi:hypothetical protein
MNARVWDGIHFRDVTVQGATLGRKLACWALKRYFRPED